MSIPVRLQSKTEPFSLVNLDGKTKKNFEMVIARYDEDISWSDNYLAYRTVYNKGLPTEYESIPLENKGHLADTILKHIISRYDSLADVTFFCHGSLNYRKDQLIKESGNCHKRWKDFIRTDSTTCVYIDRSDLPSSNQRFYEYPQTFGSFYQSMFKKPFKGGFRWACGLWLSVSKEKILGRPKEFYQMLHDWILEDYEGGEPSQLIYRTRGIYIERILIHAF